MRDPQPVYQNYCLFPNLFFLRCMAIFEGQRATFFAYICAASVILQIKYYFNI